MLHGIRVLDLCDESGQLAGKILGDLGADVIAVEPPEGKALRHRGPFLGGVPGVEHSLAWQALNTSKRSIRVDLAPRRTASGSTRSPRAPTSGSTPLRMKAAPRTAWIPPRLRARHPRLVVCTITPFGLDGPWAHYRAAISSSSRWAATRPSPATPTARRCAAACRPPTTTPLPKRRSASRWPCTRAKTAAAASSSTCRCTRPSSSRCSRFRRRRRCAKQSAARRAADRETREIWRAADGYVSFGLRGGPTRLKNLIATVAYMAECGAAPDWLRDYDWEHYNHNMLDAAEIARLEDAFGAFFATRTMRDLYEQALARRILLAPCNDAREILEHRQLRERELFVSVELAELAPRSSCRTSLRRPPTARSASAAARRGSASTRPRSSRSWRQAVRRAARRSRAKVGREESSPT